MQARFGVLGWPVAHSRSPVMMRAAGLDRYQLLPVSPEDFNEAVRALGGAGFAGANVTIPHKERALALAETASASAREIGAANTLSFHADGAISADNTDAPGLLAAIAGRAEASAVVLGAGGSARAAIWALRAIGSHVSVWNRSADRARALADEFGVRHLGAQPLPPADLLVNCTSVGLVDPTQTFAALPLVPESLQEYGTVVDLVYRPGGTELFNQAQAHGVVAVDGLEVLIQQGALSFALWTGREAPVDAMRRAVRSPPA